MNFRMPVLIATAVLSLASFQAVADEGLKLSNKWRIEVSEGANSDGNIVFRVTPDQGTPTDVTIAIKDGRGENNVASDISDGTQEGPRREGLQGRARRRRGRAGEEAQGPEL